MYMYTNCSDGAAIYNVLGMDRYYICIIEDGYGVPCVGLGYAGDEVYLVKGADVRDKYPDKEISDQALLDYFAAVIGEIHNCLASGITHISVPSVEAVLADTYVAQWPNKDGMA